MSDSTGKFHVAYGQVLDPDGNVFTARGIAVNPSRMADASQILADFPGLNFVRLTVYDYDPPETYAAFVNTMTSHGIVVEFEDHTSSDGADQGGSRGVAFTGTQLTNELNWYSSVAQAYAANPYVWFGTDNEPPNDGLTAWQKQTYDAIRNAGNPNPIMLELPGGAYPGAQTATSYGLDPNVYAAMTNIIADVHEYGWSSNFSTDQAAVNDALSDLVQGANTIPSINGNVPVILGEYGISTEGVVPDPNADQVLWTAQHASQTVGAVAFTWYGSGADSLTDDQGNLTAYGREVAQWIGAHAGTGGNVSPTTAIVSQDTISNLVTPATSMSLIPGTTDSAGQAADTGTSSAGNEILSAAATGSFVDQAGGTLPELAPASASSDWTGTESVPPVQAMAGDYSDATSNQAASMYAPSAKQFQV